MRLFWASFLMTSLFLIGLSAYDRRQLVNEPVTQQEIVAASEDGTPMPQPYPTPRPKL